MHSELHGKRPHSWRRGQIHGGTSTCHEETSLAVHQWSAESPARCSHSTQSAFERKNHGERAENSAWLVSMAGTIGCEVVQHLPGEETKEWRWWSKDHWAFVFLQAIGRLDPEGAWKGSSSKRSCRRWCLLHFEGSDASWCQSSSWSCLGFASWQGQSVGAGFRFPQYPAGGTFCRPSQKAWAPCWIVEKVQLPHWCYSSWRAGQSEGWRSWSTLGDLAWWTRCGSHAQLTLRRKPVLATLARGVLPSSCNDEVTSVHSCENSLCMPNHVVLWMTLFEIELIDTHFSETAVFETHPSFWEPQSLFETSLIRSFRHQSMGAQNMLDTDFFKHKFVTF